MRNELKKIIGSLLVLGFEGPRLSDSLKNFLEQWDLGGVILFKRNIESFPQLLELNAEIYRHAGPTPILSVDHEGGRVFRLPEPFTIFPPMRRVGDYCSRERNWAAAAETGKIFGRELRAAGFNLDYAPVLDVDSNPKNPIIGDRAFAATPEAVSQAALAFWRGLESEGVKGCGKHFPGHGDTVEDSHLTLPQVSKSWEALSACEFKPFAAAARAGIPLLMTAHVLYPALDETWPATLSEKILTGLLRRELGFQGLVISDDFFMKGITAQWPIEEAAERFLRVGGDLVLLCHQEAVQRRVAAHLVHRAEADSSFRDLLAEKAVRVSQFREELRRGIDFSTTVLPSEEHQKWARNFLA
ncbi:MAG TPA: beta-N-acetylhexosaminidase [Deltaproteobacteria bacterium]|nr:beta-N-acetylhexosaminidase [Deltaproteobacteria bacterium]